MRAADVDGEVESAGCVRCGVCRRQANESSAAVTAARATDAFRRAVSLLAATGRAGVRAAEIVGVGAFDDLLALPLAMAMPTTGDCNGGDAGADAMTAAPAPENAVRLRTSACASGAGAGE